jgi:multisubunit Na+/H+ antiporter MnhE subunit
MPGPIVFFCICVLVLILLTGHLNLLALVIGAVIGALVAATKGIWTR